MRITLAPPHTCVHQILIVIQAATDRVRRLLSPAALPIEGIGAIGVLVSGALFFTLAQAAPAMPSRSLEADAIAATFAAGHADPTDAQRLDFAPGLATALRQATAAASATGDGAASWGAGAIVIRGLPRGSSLSSGVVFDDGTWVVSQADLDGMLLTLGGSPPPAHDIVLELIGAAGTPERQVAFRLTHADGVAAGLPSYTSARFGNWVAADIRTGTLGHVETSQSVRRRLRPENAKSRSLQRTRASRTTAAKRVKSAPLTNASVPANYKPASGLAGPPAASVFGSLLQTGVPAASVVPPAESFPLGPMEREAARR